jgi:phage RecT family recombinase
MENTNQLLVLEDIEQHLKSRRMIEQFKGFLGDDTLYFINSVLITVESNEKIQKCTPESIGVAALQAATLRLSCLPQLKQAYIIPYLRRKKLPTGGWSTYYEAKFSTHYLGEYTLAMRTGLYAIIDVIATPKGYRLVNMLGKGEQLIDENDQPVTMLPKMDPTQAGGWYGYFMTHDGITKQIHMTKQETHKHAQLHNPQGYAADGSMWKDPKKCFYMEMKTALRELLRWTEKSTQTYGTRRRPENAIEIVEGEEVNEVLPSSTAIPVDAMFAR